MTQNVTVLDNNDREPITQSATVTGKYVEESTDIYKSSQKDKTKIKH